MLLDDLRRLYCSAHGAHTSSTPFTEKPRELRVPAGADRKETTHPRVGQFGLASTSFLASVIRAGILCVLFRPGSTSLDSLGAMSQRWISDERGPSQNHIR